MVYSRARGFTLIELLVVIAIIAIMAAILFPVIAAAKQRASMANCLSNQKQLATAFRSYMDDFNGFMPKLKPWYSLTPNNLPPPANWCGASYPYACWIERGSLWPYIRNLGVYQCRTDVNQPAINIIGDPKDYPLSYSANYQLDMVNLDGIRVRQSRMLLLIHEGRNTINDGYLHWEADDDDLPSKLHYSGTTACFADSHATYLSYKELMKRRWSGEWKIK